ncbi:hypothetical protein SDC9_190464 [bioreactor metagenome]|uniref:Uncharacterized protein n=1 Tax=bioreactor metagenome TaxID=1076179 RepID=A0A645HWF0_9ZZZZ
MNHQAFSKYLPLEKPFRIAPGLIYLLSYRSKPCQCRYIHRYSSSCRISGIECVMRYRENPLQLYGTNPAAGWSVHLWTFGSVFYHAWFCTADPGSKRQLRQQNIEAVFQDYLHQFPGCLFLMHPFCASKHIKGSP